MSDVERFRATVELFAQLDDRFGGGHARQPLIHYLRSDGERLLRGRYPETVGSTLYSAVAEATLLAGVDELRQHAAQPACPAVFHPGTGTGQLPPVTGCWGRASWTR